MINVKSKIQLNCQHLVYFGSGLVLGLFLLALIFLVSFEINYQNRIYPQVFLGEINVAGLNKEEIKNKLKSLDQQPFDLNYIFVFDNNISTLSAQTLKLRLNTDLLAEQAFLIGRSGNFFTKTYQKYFLFKKGLSLPLSYSFDANVLDEFLNKLSEAIDIVPTDALFEFSQNKVSAFRLSSTGRKLDKEKAKADFNKLLLPLVSGTIQLNTLVLEPKIKTDKINNLGVKELVAQGVSYFAGSIPNRIFNINRAAEKLHGLLIAPDEVFSFNQAVGEISDKTGYKPAYVIKEKKTVLDDGGGVCQVSTTLFRAALNTGLPIIERQGHAYRVGYYEQGNFGLGFDATVYNPNVDLKIKNDTQNYLLIQTQTNQQNLSLTIQFYGTKDERIVTLGKAKIWDEVKPPEDLYQDDGNLAKGQIKQVDFPAWGAKVSFDYKVIKNEEILQDTTFYSSYQPWQAVFLRGTKE